MPEIFEYLGIILFFYSNEHEPIYDTTHGEFESKAGFYIISGKVSETRIKLVKDRKPLKGSKLKDFEKFLEVYYLPNLKLLTEI